LKFKQFNLIKSLEKQPLIVVIRLQNDFFDITHKRDELFLNIKKLSEGGIKHIEIGWTSNPQWNNLLSEIKNNFGHINIGAASITSQKALNSILELNLNYSMSPYFHKELHLQAIENNQLLIPGVSNLETLKEAVSIGYKIIKIFPASNLGINFINKIKILNKNHIFFIGAGGIKSKDLKEWINHGYNALAIGRGLQNQKIDINLERWLKSYSGNNSKKLSL